MPQLRLHQEEFSHPRRGIVTVQSYDHPGEGSYANYPPSDLTVFLGRTNPQSVLLDSGEIMTKLISDRYLRVGDHLNLRSATIAAATPHIEITSKSCQVQGEVCAVA
jgi:hypothetical protein